MPIRSYRDIEAYQRANLALEYVSQDICQPYIEQYTIVAKQLNKLIQIWRKF
jgi:hypothetical protein